MRYLLCNKPLNVICSKRNDAINPRKPHSAERVTIYEHVSALGYDVQHLALVGRLDVETTGAILFTDDVELMDHLLRPPNTTALASSYCFKEKQYRLVLLGRPPFHRLSSASREDIVRIETELAEPLEQCQRAAVCITRGPYRVESLSNNNNVDMGWCLEATVVISEENITKFDGWRQEASSSSCRSRDVHLVMDFCPSSQCLLERLGS